MPDYKLSKAAALDILRISENSTREWGILRAKQYVGSLEDMFSTLAAFPNLGRDAGHVRPGCYRMETASHSIFYRQSGDQILIIRILHERMDFMKHIK